MLFYLVSSYVEHICRSYNTQMLHIRFLAIFIWWLIINIRRSSSIQYIPWSIDDFSPKSLRNISMRVHYSSRFLHNCTILPFTVIILWWSIWHYEMLKYSIVLNNISYFTIVIFPPLSLNIFLITLKVVVYLQPHTFP